MPERVKQISLHSLKLNIIGKSPKSVQWQSPDALYTLYPLPFIQCWNLLRSTWLCPDTKWKSTCSHNMKPHSPRRRTLIVFLDQPNPTLSTPCIDCVQHYIRESIKSTICKLHKFRTQKNTLLEQPAILHHPSEFSLVPIACSDSFCVCISSLLDQIYYSTWLTKSYSCACSATWSSVTCTPIS